MDQFADKPEFRKSDFARPDSGDPDSDASASEGATGARLNESGRSPLAAVRSFVSWRRRGSVTVAEEDTAAPAEATSPSNVGRIGRSPLAAAALSFVWPGLGQFAQGRRRSALIFTVPAIVFVLWVLLQLDQGPVFFIASLWDGGYAAMVILVVLAFGIWRGASVGHALYTGLQGRRPRMLDYGVAGVLIAAIVGMHGLFVAGAWTWYQTAQSIQSNDLLARVYAAASDDPSPSPAPSDSFAPAASATATPEPTPTPAASPVRNPDRITLLLVGADAAGDRQQLGSRTDTMMVLSLDMKTEVAAMISVPRDTSSFPLYYGGVVGPTFKLNTLMNTVSAKRLPSPDEPMKTLENEIGYLVGIPIDYYAFLDMDGLARMIDAIGGIDVYNQRAINDPGTGVILPVGMVHLSGPETVLYVRSRENGGSDYLRAARQQNLLVTIEKKVLSPSGLSRLGTLLNLASYNIATDFPLKTANKYVSAIQHVKTINSCVLGPPYSWTPPMSETGGTWTSRLDLQRVGNLSVQFFGEESAYFGRYGVAAAPC